MRVRIIDDQDHVIWAGEIEDLLKSFLGTRRRAAEPEDEKTRDYEAFVRRAFLARQSRAAQMAGKSLDEFIETYGDIDYCPVRKENEA